MKLLTTEEIIEHFGKPNEKGEPYITTIELPYPMRLAWDLNTTIRKMRCHKLIAQPLLNVFNELLATYGLDAIKRLEIDLFGGCFVYRAMRGGKQLSRHSWGIAIDLSPAKNDLKTPFDKSQFGGAGYMHLHEIFEKHGFLNYGKVKNYDSMHFEFCAI